MKIYKHILTICFEILLSLTIRAQEKEATMTLKFEKAESNNLCNVHIMSENKPVADVAVKLYVKRLFGLLQIGKDITTDESGIASFEFPSDIPLNSDGKLLVIAKVEEDENYGNLETEIQTKIGIAKEKVIIDKQERSIAGVNAPIYFIVASLVVFAGIWGAIVYVIFLVFKIKKSATKLNS